MASIHTQENQFGHTYRVKWRDDGRQRSISFEDKPSAQIFKANLERYGTVEAERILELEEAQASVPTVAAWLETYIDNLTGVGKSTLADYRRFASRDITPHIGDMPLIAVTEHTIAQWVQTLETQKRGGGKTLSGKSIANVHGFLSGAFNAAVPKLIPNNPCKGRRLPTTRSVEMVFLTPDEFWLLHDCIQRDYWRRFAAWLVLTGMRFSEAAALTPDDVDPVNRTVRISKAWKDNNGRYPTEVGPPKTNRSKRTISIPQDAIDLLDLTQPEWLFTNSVGNPVRSQEFYNRAWGPARIKAVGKGLKKRPRVHDLRHTCASWMIQAGVPLPVIQRHLGHESITTTIDRYGHLDRSTADIAAAALGATFRRPELTAKQRLALPSGGAILD